MTLSVGSTTFDRVSFDREADVLYLSVEGTEAARWEETPEGHLLRFTADGDLCGLTVIGVSHHLDSEGRLPVTLPQRAEIASEDLGLATA
jgi:uncharacterized protein YuzE